jgi:hypothetical protein
MKGIRIFNIVLIIAGLFSPVCAQTKTPVHVFELAQGITEQLAKTYPSCLVRAAWKVNTNNVLSYEIRMVKGNMEYSLLYDKDGKFLRKEPVSIVIEEKKPIIHKRERRPILLEPLEPLPAPDSIAQPL